MRLRQKGGRRRAEGGIPFHRSRCAHHFPLPPSPFPPRNAITLIEVLISMFVLLFGLMGVAAIFPVASHYILEGDKRDRSSGLAQVAFEELKARKILRPLYWMYTNQIQENADPVWFIQSAHDHRPNTSAANDDPRPGLFRNQTPLATPTTPSMGFAFVIDPLGGAEITPQNMFSRDLFPLQTTSTNPWNTLRIPGFSNSHSSWPVRRITLPMSESPPAPYSNSNPSPYFAMNKRTAEAAFRLHDDLAVVQPDAGDRPSIQRWRTSGTQLLSRDFVGDYSWLATVVPMSANALLGLQPGATIKDAFYEVTTVVFYKRDTVPSTSTPGSPGSERLITAEFLNETELAIYSPTTDVATANAEVNLALDGIKPGNWIAVMGVNANAGPIHPGTGLPCGLFMMKWYKVQAMDDENSVINSGSSTPANGRQGRYVMIQGPDWPSSSYTNLRVAILPGAIDAYTRVMQVDVE